MATDPAAGRDRVLCFGFNQDYSFFYTGSTVGFRVYRADSFELRVERRVGPVCHFELFHKSNIFYYVLATEQNKLLIWDDHLRRSIAELPFSSPIVLVRALRDLFIVALEKRMFVYDLNTLRVACALELVPIPHLASLVCLGNRRKIRNASDEPGPRELLPQLEDENIVVSPATTRGAFRVNIFRTVIRPNPAGAGDHPGLSATMSVIEELQQLKPIVFEAHSNDLAYAALSFDGKLVATASQKGTVIRVFDTTTRDCAFVFRRGTEPARILGLQFSMTAHPDTHFPHLLVGSNHGTLHLYQLAGEKTEKNRQEAPMLSPSSWIYPKSDKRYNIPLFSDNTVTMRCGFPIGSKMYCVSAQHDSGNIWFNRYLLHPVDSTVCLEKSSKVV